MCLYCQILLSLSDKRSGTEARPPDQMHWERLRHGIEQNAGAPGNIPSQLHRMKDSAGMPVSPSM